MKVKKEKNIILCLFNEGEDIIKNFQQIGQKYSSNLIILSALGMIKDPEIGYFKGEYIRRKFKGNFELLYYSGNIILKEGEFTPHIHVCFSGEDHITYGGHLFSAEVAMMNEIIMIKAPPFKKKIDKKSGLWLWDL